MHIGSHANWLTTFWTSYGSILTGGAVIVSAIVGIIVLISTKQIARRRATLDLILNIESDADLIGARTGFNKVKAGRTKLSTYGTEAQRTSAQAADINKVLNIHELVAVSIQENVIDERVFRRWFNRTYIDDFEACGAYITEVRGWKQNDAIFRELENLALKWKHDTDWYKRSSHASFLKRKVKAARELFSR